MSGNCSTVAPLPRFRLGWSSGYAIFGARVSRGEPLTLLTELLPEFTGAGSGRAFPLSVKRGAMGFPEIAVIAVGLSMDAFAVAITLGLSAKKPKPAEYLLPALYFGFFQALMPLAGYFAGTYFAQKIQQADHWIAFALLGFTGGKMIRDSFSNGHEKTGERPFRFTNMLLLATATSIDALAVGITFAFFKVNIVTAVIITGLTTFCISAAGVKAGTVFGIKLKSKAECAGGAVLVLLGFKILIEHVFF